MKFNQNNQQKPFNLISFLGFVAIATSLVTTATKPLAKTEAVTSITEQLSPNQNLIKPFDPIYSRGNEQTWLEIELEKEWSDILVDQSDEEILLVSSRAI